MANKIAELVANINAGARTSKYRVLVPTDDNDFSKNMDILCKGASFPGRAITPVDVVIKGKKTQITGETSLEGSWTMTFYNTTDMKVRIFFDNWIREMHTLQLPSPQNDGLLGLENLNNLVGQANEFIQSYERNVSRVEGIISDPINTLFGAGGTFPIYQRDITVQQLASSDEDSTFELTLIGAFPTSIDTIELTDDGTGISETSVTFSYSDVLINRQSPSSASILLGDNLGSLF